MPESIHPFVRLFREDPRYKPEAYEFVRVALSFGQDVLQMGTEQPTDNPEQAEERAAPPAPSSQVERHLTGQQLCESIRRYALDQYGYMAKIVLNNWGLHTTGDFGEIVYNLIRVGMMKRSKSDRREDFDDVYNFDQAFQQDFVITPPSE